MSSGTPTPSVKDDGFFKKRKETDVPTSSLETQTDTTLPAEVKQESTAKMDHIEKKRKIAQINDEIRAILDGMGPEQVNDWQKMGQDIQLLDMLDRKERALVEASPDKFNHMVLKTLEWLQARSTTIRETFCRDQHDRIVFSRTLGGTMIADLLARLIKTSVIDNRSILVVAPGTLEASLIRDKMMAKITNDDKSRLLQYGETRVWFKNLDVPSDMSKTECCETMRYSHIQFYGLNRLFNGNKGGAAADIIITFELSHDETDKILAMYISKTHCLTWEIHPR
jgi:hypothetical protein